MPGAMRPSFNFGEPCIPGEHYTVPPERRLGAALDLIEQGKYFTVTEEDRRAVSWLGTTSPFNITSEALTLPAFTRLDVEYLLTQHTAATDQRFEPDAVARVFDLSQGHPWLVNALADQAVRREVPNGLLRSGSSTSRPRRSGSSSIAARTSTR